MQDTSYAKLLHLSAPEQKEFDALEQRFRESAAWRDLPALLALPHPVRLAAMPEAAARFVVISVAEPRNQPMVTQLFRQGVATVGIYDRLLALDDFRLQIFHAIHGDALRRHGGFGAGSAGAMMHWARYCYNTGVDVFGSSRGVSGAGARIGRIYTFSDELVQLLHATRLGSDIPVSELRLPSPDIYIQLGTTRNQSPLTLTHAESGEHFLEGAYVSTCHHADGASVLEVTLTGSPLGKSGPSDDSVEWMSLYGDDQVSINDAIHKAFMVPDRIFDAAIHGDVSEHFSDQERLRKQALATVPKLELIAKCILFLNLPDATRREVLDGSDARRALLRAQSGSHRRRAARGVALSYDTVVVDAATVSEPPLAVVGHTKAAHWREGHFRGQRHGPGNSLVKVIWIRPVLVNADALSY